MELRIVALSGGSAYIEPDHNESSLFSDSCLEIPGCCIGAERNFKSGVWKKN